MEQTMEMGEQSPKRPVFLTVICIITWVGCALAIIGAITGYFTSKASCLQMEQVSDMYNGGLMGDMMESAKTACENAGINMTIGLIGGLLCLGGSIMMWNLKKAGFYIYTVGEITPAITGFFFAGSGAFGAATAIITLIIAIVWVVLYAVNLKHMR